MPNNRAAERKILGLNCILNVLLYFLQMHRIADIRVREVCRLKPPRVLREELPVTEKHAEIVYRSRERIKRIIHQKDPRLLVVVGPCSIHDIEGALDYARRLSRLREKVFDRMEVVMRVYFEKPRTSVGWKGLINDPHLDGTHDIETGLRLARQLLLDIIAMELPTATEFLDPITPQYIADLICWAAIGARTIESQTHREMASGLSMPVGFKNSTDGSMDAAINAMVASRQPHSFLGIDAEGVTSVIRTSGNEDTHIILRGGKDRPNYDPLSLEEAETKMKKAGLPPVLMVDCSHANSGKQPAGQEIVWNSTIQERIKGRRSVIGLMLESYIKEGNQKFPQPKEKLVYGLSITDPCISWETTEKLLLTGCEALSKA